MVATTTVIRQPDVRILPFWLRQGPGQHVAFVPEMDPRHLAETVVAMANADGGVILVGIDRRGRMCNIQRNEDDKWLREALTMIYPPLPVRWQWGEQGGISFLVLQVPKSVLVHSLTDGRVVIRRGDANVPVVGEHLYALVLERNPRGSETMVIPEATVSDFSPELIEHFRMQWQATYRAHWTDTTERLLLAAGAITPDATPTVAGVMLFGREPQFFLPHAEVEFILFPGTERSNNGVFRYLHRERIRGPLPRQWERLWRVVWEEIRRDERGNEEGRQAPRALYPLLAVREGLLNALVHREYVLVQRHITVHLFADRLEIRSPGGLPGMATTDTLMEEPYVRNPHIARALYILGFTQDMGTGMDMIFQSMADARHPPPEIVATPHSVTLILRGKRKGRAERNTDHAVHLNPRQVKAMLILGQRGRITSRELASVCRTSRETARLDLVDMMEKGLVKRVGDKRGTYYVLR